MRKVKYVIMLAVVLVISSMFEPASANASNHTDAKWEFDVEFPYSTEKYTSPRQKYNDTPLFVESTNNVNLWVRAEGMKVTYGPWGKFTWTNLTYKGYGSGNGGLVPQKSKRIVRSLIWEKGVGFTTNTKEARLGVTNYNQKKSTATGKWSPDTLRTNLGSYTVITGE